MQNCVVYRMTDWGSFVLCVGSDLSHFLSQPHAVYAKDVLDIEQFSTVKGVTIDQDDSEFFSKFASGCTTKPWMNEVCDQIDR